MDAAVPRSIGCGCIAKLETICPAAVWRACLCFVLFFIVFIVFVFLFLLLLLLLLLSAPGHRASTLYTGGTDTLVLPVGLGLRPELIFRFPQRLL